MSDLGVSEEVKNTRFSSKERSSIQIDKISSVAAKILDSHDVVVGDVHEAKQGDVVAVRVAVDSEIRNLLELGSGRMASIAHGDVLAGVLGKRRALKGFVGYVPEKLSIGESINILNLGGVMGKVTGSLQGLPSAAEVEYLGHVLNGGAPINVSQGAVEVTDDFVSPIPLIVVAGTCMQAGKTKAAGELVKRFKNAGFRVAGAKLTGISCARDTLAMADSGAIATMDFLDCGLPSTIDLSSVAPLAKTISKRLGQANPDVIVMELGDGIMGYYNVDTLFDDPQVMSSMAALVLCANDFVGAWGGVEFLKAKGSQLPVVSGPATDSGMAIEFVEKKFGVHAANAMNGGDRLFQIIKEKVEKWQQQRN